jgi:hypothetical protein
MEECEWEEVEHYLVLGRTIICVTCGGMYKTLLTLLKGVRTAPDTAGFMVSLS